MLSLDWFQKHDRHGHSGGAWGHALLLVSELHAWGAGVGMKCLREVGRLQKLVISGYHTQVVSCAPIV